MSENLIEDRGGEGDEDGAINRAFYISATRSTIKPSMIREDAIFSTISNLS